MSLSQPKTPGNQVNWIPKWQVPQNRDGAYGLLHLWQDIRGRRKSVKEKPAKILMKSKRSSEIDLRHWVSVPSGDTWQCRHTFLVVIAVVWYFEHTQKSPPIIHSHAHSHSPLSTGGTCDLFLAKNRAKLMDCHSCDLCFITYDSISVMEWGYISCWLWRGRLLPWVDSVSQGPHGKELYIVSKNWESQS